MLVDESRSVEELVNALSIGASAKYVFFWRHGASEGASIGAGVLSQWQPSPFEVDGVAYLTAEHWMMAEKARLFDDTEILDRILASEHPGAAQKLGRRVRGFRQAVWEERRFEIVVRGSVHKFGSRPELRSYLLGTGQRVLVEASPIDRIWGIGLDAKTAATTPPDEWRGLNLLGFALMEARSRLSA